MALYPAVIPSFHLLPLINNWRYWLPLFPTDVQDSQQIDWYPGLTQDSLNIPRPLTGLRDWHKSSLHISETPQTEHGFSPTLKSYQRMRAAHEIVTGQTDEPKKIRAELQACPDPRKTSQFALTLRSYCISHPKCQQGVVMEFNSTLPQEDQSSGFKISTPNMQTCWRLRKSFTQTVWFWQTGHRTTKGSGLVHATFMSQTLED